MTQNSNIKDQSQNAKLKTDLKTRCYNYSIKIIQMIAGLPKERVYWVLGDQLMRSATSIGANIVEAKSASSKRDFINYYEVALKSANETLYWLGLLRDALHFNEAEIRSRLNETEEIAKIIAASVITMKNKRQI